MLRLFVVFTPLSLKCLAESNDDTCSITGYFILPNGETELKSNGIGLLAVKFTNNTKSIIELDAIKSKGVEQLSENPMPARQPGVVPCYLATLLVDFIDSGGRIIHQDIPTLTVSGNLKPNDEITCLLSVRLPASSGVFRVKLSRLTPAKHGQFAFDEKSPKNGRKNISSLTAITAEIDSVRINTDNQQ